MEFHPRLQPEPWTPLCYRGGQIHKDLLFTEDEGRLPSTPPPSHPHHHCRAVNNEQLEREERREDRERRRWNNSASLSHPPLLHSCQSKCQDSLAARKAPCQASVLKDHTSPKALDSGSILLRSSINSLMTAAFTAIVKKEQRERGGDADIA